jgi:energy-coupling factor transporter transmembrane protein EcfT
VAGSKDDKSTQNIFQIMDQIVHQLNKTKKMFLIMIVSIIVVVPGTFIVTFALAGGSSFWNDGGPPNGFTFGIARTIVIVFVLAWIVIGIRQWFVLSKWTQRYEIYKELQKKIDEKLDYNNDNNEEKGVKE